MGPAEQVAALKQLKNFIVGHDHRKELVVRRGLIPQLSRVLQSNVKSAGKRRHRQLNGGAGASAVPESIESWGHEDEERLQATLIVGSLAVGKSIHLLTLRSSECQFLSDQALLRWSALYPSHYRRRTLGTPLERSFSD